MPNFYQATQISQTSRRRITILAYIVLLFSGVVQAESPTQGDLKVVVTGMKNDQGQLVANLFREGDDIHGHPLAKQQLAIVNKQATPIFPNLKMGRYAVLVFHDLNNNNDLDHNLLRLPAEPLGFSNGFELSLTSGKPNSQKLAFAVNAQTETVIHIKVK